MRKIPYHRYAFTLSLILQSEFQRPPRTQPYDELVFDVLQRAVELANWTQELRADFYARLMSAWEMKKPESFLDIQETVTRCLIAAEDAEGV